MKQKINVTRFVRLKTSLFTILACFTILIISCNENKEKEKSEADEKTSDNKVSSDTQSQKAVVALSGDLYTLKLTKVQYDSLKNYKGKKLVLQFLFKTTDPKSPTLLLYPSKSGNKFFPNNTSSKFNPVELEPQSAFRPVDPYMIFGDQQINTDDIDKFLSDNGINPANPYTLIFSPDLDASKHVFYRISAFGIEAMVGALSTNPSPPKDAN